MNKRISKLLFYIIFVIVSVCFAYMFIVMPNGQDDWWYLGQLMYYGENSNGHHNLLMGLKECIIDHYNYDNARIGNTLGIISLCISNKLYGYISSVCFIISLVLMIKLSKIKTDQYLKLVLLCFLMVFSIRWEDHMFTNMFAFNYVIGTPFFLLAVYLYLKEINILQAIILGLVVGSWHESFGLALLIGSIGVILLNKRKCTKARILMIISNVVGLLWIFVFPSFVFRVNQQINGNVIDLNYCIYFIDWFLSVLFIIILISKRSWKILNMNPIYIYTILSGLFILPIGFIMYSQRPVMPVLLLSICSIIISADSLLRKNFYRHQVSYNILGVVIFIVMVVHLFSAAIDSYKIKTSIDDLYKNVAENIEGDEIYFETHFPNDYLPTSINMPDMDFFEYGESLKYYLHTSEDILLIPLELKKYSRKDNELNTPFEIWGNYIISNRAEDVALQKIFIKYENWSEYRLCKTIPFIGKNDKNYVCIIPLRSKIGHFMGKIVEATYNNESN